MVRIASVIKYRLLELRNETVARPAMVLLWLPRPALLSFTSYLLYRWLLSGSEFRMAVLFVTIPILGLALCLLTSYQKLFGAKEDMLLLTTPLSTPQFLLAKYAEVLVALLEVAVFLSVPVLLAVTDTMSLPKGILVFLSLMLNVLLAWLMGIPGALLVVRALCLKRRILLLALVGLGAMMLCLVITSLLGHSISIRLPHWFWTQPVPVLASQTAMLGATAFLALKYASVTYLDTRARLFEGNRHAGPAKTGKAPMNVFLTRFRGSGCAILIKDTMMNLRSPMQWLRTVLMLGLLPVYPLVRGWFGDGTPESFLGLNVSFACLLGFVLIGEVVANAFSAELNRIRIMLATPVPVWKILIAKLCAYYLPTVVLCEVSILVLDLLSGLSIVGIAYSFLLTALATAGIVALLVGMGALSAKPDRDSRGGMDEFMAEQAFFTGSSSFLVFLLGSAVMALNALLVMTPLLFRTCGVELGTAALPLTVFLVLEANLLVAGLSLSCGSRLLARLLR